MIAAMSTALVVLLAVVLIALGLAMIFGFTRGR